jgi:2-polyprenyl-6-methoxyphenol hydroxylase-like FAD-dependent oxidoreductase
LGFTGVGTRLDIAVAGAGPAGLATALYLHRDGHNVTLFERFEQPHPVGSGLMLQPTGRAVLHDLGLHDEIAALGQPLDRLIGHDARTGRVVLDVRYKSIRKLGRGLGVHRAALFNVLHDGVVADAIPVRTNFTVGTLDRRGGKTWLIGAKGTEGPFDLIVDAMGSSSPLKAHAKVPSTAEPLAFGALWATVPWVDGPFDARALMQRYEDARVMIGVLPIGRQTRGGPPLAAFFWSLKTEEHLAVMARGLNAFREECTRRWPDTAAHIDAMVGMSAMTLAKYAHHTLKVPAGEGIAFVGDSAHSTSPQLGQGANMALLDARALAVSLRELDDIGDALKRYAIRRRWHVRLYQFLSRTLTPFYQSDSTVLPKLRDTAVSIGARVWPAPQILAAMVAGQILSPMKVLGLNPPPVLEDRAE